MTDQVLSSEDFRGIKKHGFYDVKNWRYSLMVIDELKVILNILEYNANSTLYIFILNKIYMVHHQISVWPEWIPGDMLWYLWSLPYDRLRFHTVGSVQWLLVSKTKRQNGSGRIAAAEVKKKSNPDAGLLSMLIFMKSLDYLRKKKMVMKKGQKNRTVFEIPYRLWFCIDGINKWKTFQKR